MKKRLFVFILMFGIFFLVKVNVSGAVSFAFEEKLREERLVYVINDKIKRHTTDRKNIMDMKIVKDFAGNNYKVIELSPTGYLIYSVDSGVFVETGLNSPSPYLNYYDNLYYGGPTFYYRLVGDKLVHTVIEENLESKNMDNYKHTSVEMYETLQAKKDEAVLQYVKTGNKTLYQAGRDVSIQNTHRGIVYNTNFFRNLTSPGYVDGGYCGYIALNMIIAYHDKHKNRDGDDIMDYKYWINWRKESLYNEEDSLTQYLIDLKYYYGTNCYDIENVMKEYQKVRGLSYNLTARLKPLYTIATVMAAIDNNTPVIGFGKLGLPDGSGTAAHSVVIYIYEAKMLWNLVYDADYTVHYGWYGYTEIILTGTLTGIFYFDY